MPWHWPNGLGRGLRFVTQAGELLAADGTLYVGPRHSTTGLISRRSELRVLDRQIAEIGRTDRRATRPLLAARCARSTSQESELAAARAGTRDRSANSMPSRDRRLRSAEERPVAAREAAGGRRSRTRRGRERIRAGDHHARPSCSRSWPQAEVRPWRAGRQHSARRPASQSRWSNSDAALSREAGATKIEVVKSEQRLVAPADPARASSNATIRNAAERWPIAVRNSKSASSGCATPSATSCGPSRELAELYLRKEALCRRSRRGSSPSATSGASARRELTAEAQRVRGKIRKLEARAARPGSGRRRSAARTDDAGRSACARTTASNWPSSNTSPRPKSCRSGRKSNGRSPNCAASSTASAA